MRQKLPLFLALLLPLTVLCWGFYSIIYQPYVILPDEDRAFLTTAPMREQVLQRFGRPAEELRAGERFPMTGWHPLPERVARHSALSFVRRYGGKIYVFFGPDGALEHFVISHS